MKKTALVIESEPKTRELIKSLLEKACLGVSIAKTISEGLELAKSEAPDLVLMNLYQNAPEVDDSGLNLLRQLRTETNLPVIVTGRVISLEYIRTVMRLGAYDYVPLPLCPENLLNSIKNLLNLQSLQEEVEKLRKEVDEQYNLNGIIYRSQEMSRIVKLIPQIANSSSSVLIIGESGTGYRPTVILAEDRYQMWYENGGDGHYKIEHAVSEATDIARISPIEYRIRSSKSVGSRVRLTIEVSFKNFGPGKAQAAEATLIDTAPNISILSVSRSIRLGDIEANQTVCGIIELRLARPIPSDIADLNLRWRVEYIDAVMGDRHFYLI